MRKLSQTILLIFVLVLSLFTPCGNVFAQEDEFIEEEIVEEVIEENHEDIVIEGFNVYYRYFLADSDGTIPLPDEVMKTLPENKEYKDGETVKPELIDSSGIDGFSFLGWEPMHAIIDGKDLIFSGIWRADDPSVFNKKAPMLRAASTLYSGFGSLAWGLKEATYIGTYNFLLGGKQAYCIELDIPIPAAGSKYNFERKDSSKLARIIGKGTLNGMSPGAIQATVWNYIAKDKSRAWVTTGESVDYDDSRYSGGSCTISIYSPDATYQRFAILEGCGEDDPDPQPGYLRVLKKAQDKYGFNYVAHSETYSLAGAKYGVYTNKDCTNLKATLTTKADGSTDSIRLDIGTYYVKEIEPSPGFKIDEKVYTAVIPDSGNITVTSIEEPYLGSAKLNKVAAKTDYDYLSNCPNNYTLENAVYGIYADENCSKLITEIRTDSQGKTQTIPMPEGIYYVKEISPSYGFKLDENVYMIDVKTDETAHVESIEEPLSDPIKIVLRKSNIKDEEDTKYLEETEFTLRYYDTRSKDLSDMQAKYTWIFKTIVSDGKAEVMFDKSHYLKGDKLLLDKDGNFFIPLGVFTIEESKAPQTYARDENIYVGRVLSDNGKTVIEFDDGEWMKKENTAFLFSDNSDIKPLHLRQGEKKIIIKTTSVFEESGNDRYVADGIAHINDLVEYDHLIPGKEYLLKAKLISKKSKRTLSENSVSFIPENESGNVTVKLTVDLDGFDDSDLVVYEYLYYKDDPDTLISKHEDINDEGQTVHVERLYRASMVLYKVGGTQDVKLNGAIFNISTERKRRDGKVIKKDLGRFVSGGIYIEQENPFVYEISRNKDMNNIRTYKSKIHPTFGIEHVCITDLSDGTYYGRFQGQSKVEEYYVEKGMILLTDMPENTKITYTELLSPKGYYLNPDPYTVNVGDDNRLTRIDNYRTNKAIIIPKTGIE